MDAKTLIAYNEAREKAATDFPSYMRFMNPDSSDPFNVSKSSLLQTPVLKVLGETFQRIIWQPDKRKPIFFCSVRPQVGKTTITAGNLMPYLAGIFPDKQGLYLTYNQDRADYVSSNFIRPKLLSKRQKQVFPEFGLKTLKVSSMSTTAGGAVNFAGFKGMVTGLTGDYVVVDDPYSGYSDAHSITKRSDIWLDFIASARTRTNDNSIVIVIHTRWDIDDIIGRFCDIDHPGRLPQGPGKQHSEMANGYSLDVSKTNPADYEYLTLPAVITDLKQAEALGIKLELPTNLKVIEAFGDVPMASLKHDESLESLADKKGETPAKLWASLYESQPRVSSGVLFAAEMFSEISHESLYPKDLIWFTGSDHAVATGKDNDESCAGGIGLDKKGDWWVSPHLFWGRFPSDELCRNLVQLFGLLKPVIHFPEKDMIWQAIYPQVMNLMEQSNTYTMIKPVPVRDLEGKCAPLLFMMQNKRVHFPSFAPWYQRAKTQMLQFPNVDHDDFVSFLAQATSELPFHKNNFATPPVKAVIDPHSLSGLKLEENSGNVVSFPLMRAN